MGTRTIAVSDEVYNQLKSLKRPDESFTDLLRRLAGKPSLLQLVGVRSLLLLPHQRVIHGRSPWRLPPS